MTHKHCQNRTETFDLFQRERVSRSLVPITTHVKDVPIMSSANEDFSLLFTEKVFDVPDKSSCCDTDFIGKGMADEDHDNAHEEIHATSYSMANSAQVCVTSNKHKTLEWAWATISAHMNLKLKRLTIMPSELKDLSRLDRLALNQEWCICCIISSGGHIIG